MMYVYIPCRVGGLFLLSVLYLPANNHVWLYRKYCFSGKNNRIKPIEYQVSEIGSEESGTYSRTDRAPSTD